MKWRKDKKDRELVNSMQKLQMCEPCKRGRHDNCLNKIKGVDCICKLMDHQR